MSDTLTFAVPGMTCGHCESAIVAEVGSVSGVSSVVVNLDTKVVTVTGESIASSAVVAAIDEAGFDVES